MPFCRTLIPAVLAAWLCFCLGSVVADTPGRKIAFVIGVQNYNHSSLADLQFAERDATELADRLKKAGFEVVLLTTGSAEKPTYENITSRVKKQLGQVTKHDMLVVAMSGHGLQFDDSDENFFCPLDANPATRERLFSLKKLVADMDASGAGTKLLLVDACRDEPKLPRNSKGASGDSIDSLPRGVAALFSCAASEIAWESDKAGGGHGIFFHTVIEGLDGEAANGMGEVTWDRLVAHVKENVPVRVREWVGERVRQRPHQVASLEDNPVLVRVARTITKPVESMRRPTSETSSNAKSITSKTTGAKLLLIPAGEFLMGSPDSDTDAKENEKPQHRVKITRPFYLGETEVTQKQWRVVMGTEPWKGKYLTPDGDSYPATCVSWDDAVEYCNRLGNMDGREYRLPTEAEWEYACRAGSDTIYSFGSDVSILLDYAVTGTAVTGGTSLNEKPEEVGSRLPNKLGLYDMHANAEELCFDWYAPFKYTTALVIDPEGPIRGEERVTRSGDNDGAQHCRSASRSSINPSLSHTFLGFRLASSSGE